MLIFRDVTYRQDVVLTLVASFRTVVLETTDLLVYLASAEKNASIKHVGGQIVHPHAGHAPTPGKLSMNALCM